MKNRLRAAGMVLAVLVLSSCAGVPKHTQAAITERFEELAGLYAQVDLMTREVGEDVVADVLPPDFELYGDEWKELERMSTVDIGKLKEAEAEALIEELDKEIDGIKPIIPVLQELRNTYGGGGVMEQVEALQEKMLEMNEKMFEVQRLSSEISARDEEVPEEVSGEIQRILAGMAELEQEMTEGTADMTAQDLSGFVGRLDTYINDLGKLIEILAPLAAA